MFFILYTMRIRAEIDPQYILLVYKGTKRAGPLDKTAKIEVKFDVNERDLFALKRQLEI